MQMRLKNVTLLLFIAVLLFSGCTHRDSKKDVNAFNEGDEGIIELLDTTTQRTLNGKVIYLTFDDGPGLYTEHLLSILAKYDVKATFFVTNFRPECQFLLKREYIEGHTVAVHTYTHDYANIYSSVENYWKDYDLMDANIFMYTGQHAQLMRFPGGSSNTVSLDYMEGIMTTLTNQMNNRGIAYFDWNVDSNDAGSANTSEEVAANIQKGVENHDVSVVLCHDVKQYTVEAMETFIPWALQEGYEFKRCTPDSPPAHHDVNN